MSASRIITNHHTALIAKPVVLLPDLLDWLEGEKLVTKEDYGRSDAPIHGIVLNADKAPASTVAEVGGRLCYNSFQAGRDSDGWHTNIQNEKHGSVYAHGMYTFAVAGVSRSLTHELARHQIGIGFSQESQRYVIPDDAKFVAPPLHLERWDGDLDSRDAQTWLSTQLDAVQQYNLDYAEAYEYLGNEYPELSKRDLKKKAAESARSSFPNAIETRLIWSVNLRAGRHVMAMRNSMGADAEIARWGNDVFSILRANDAPAFIDFDEKVDMITGRKYATSANGGI